MIIIDHEWNFEKSKKKITELAALYYAAKYEDYICNGENVIRILPHGHIYDMVVTKSINSPIQEGIRFIEVKGNEKERPQSTRVYESIQRLPPYVSPSRYLFYIIYNIYINQNPGISIFGWDFFQEASHKGKDGTWHILGVNKAAKKGRIPDSPGIFNTFTVTKRKTIINFFEGEKNNNIEVVSNPFKITNTELHTIDHGSLIYEDSKSLGPKILYDGLLTFIGSLGDDIKREYEQRRLSYSSISKRNKKRVNLLRIYAASRVAWTIWLRKETSDISYPREIEKLSEFTSEGDSKDLGFAHFKIKNESDLNVAKKIIKFAYDYL